MKRIIVSIVIVAAAIINTFAQSAKIVTFSNSQGRICSSTKSYGSAQIMNVNGPETFWFLEEEGSHYYIKNTLTDVYVSVTGTEAEDNSVVQAPNKYEKSRWSIVKSGTGQVVLKNITANVFLTTTLGGNSKYLEVTDSESEAVKWTMTEYSKENTWLKYPIKDYVSKGEDIQWIRLKSFLGPKGLLSSGGNRAVGSEVKVLDVSNEISKWKVIKKEGGYYQLQNLYSGLYLANFGAEDRGSVLKQTNNPRQGALWKFEKQRGGLYYLRNKKTGFTLAQDKNYTAIQGDNRNWNSWKITSNKGLDQMLSETNTGGDQTTSNASKKSQVQFGKTYELKSNASPYWLSSDINSVQGSFVQISSRSSVFTQWIFEDAGGGYVKIKNKKTGLYVANFRNMANDAKMKFTNNPGQGAHWKVISYEGNVKFQNRVSNHYLACRKNDGRVMQVQHDKDYRAVWKLVGR